VLPLPMPPCADLVALKDKIGALPSIATYLASPLRHAK
jgi:hypothetical protein